MKTGLFFGSFNPVHVGHLVIGKYMVQYTDLDQLWFVVSPQNPLKNKKDLLNKYERLEMLRLATEDDNQLRPCDIEFHLPVPTYTINTLLHLQEKHPNREWVLIMGADTIETLPKWKNYKELLNNYEIYVYPRPGYTYNPANYPASVKYIENVPLMEISASFIRQSLKNRKSVRYLVPDKVEEYMAKGALYRV